MLVSWQKGISPSNFLCNVTFGVISTTESLYIKPQTTSGEKYFLDSLVSLVWGVWAYSLVLVTPFLANFSVTLYHVSQMNTVQLYPQYSKTLELIEKHDKHVLQFMASCY